MIGPTKKTSKRRTRIRHATRQTGVIKKLAASTQVVKCRHCQKAKLSHRVCGNCGWYGDSQVMTIKSKGSNTVLEA